MKPTPADDNSEAATASQNNTTTQFWFRFLRLAWLSFAILTLSLYILDAPNRYAEMRAVPPEEVQALARWGLTPDHHALYHVLTEHALVLVFIAVAAVLFWRKPNDWLVLFVSAYLITFTAPPTLGLIHEASWPLRFIYSIGNLGGVLLFLFPDGRFFPRWTRWLTVAWAAWVVSWAFVPALNPETWPTPGVGQGGLGLPAFLAQALFAAIGLYAQVYRYRSVSTPAQRQQTKWVIYGIAVLIIGFIIAYLPEYLFPDLAQPGMSHLIYRTLRKIVLVLSRCAVPVTLAIAILRYRLWDIDLVINRTLVYSTLTAITIGIYVLIVGSLGVVFQTNATPVIPFMATGLVAVIFQPLRDRLQRGVNRLMYGDRDDPYAVLLHLRQRLNLAVAPQAVLPAIVETVAQTLKLPYAAIRLNDETVIASGDLPPQAKPESFPLVYQGETIGQLNVAPRSPDESFIPAERRLLADIAHEAGVAAHAVRLTADLQRARERLVTTREEERRRLRRDLHDGLGPKLAGQTLILEAICDSLRPEDEASRALINHLIEDSQTVVSEVRQLVHGLRPPALDELGLVAAVKAQAAQAEIGGLRVSVNAPDPMPSLSAAVEVAAYRIVQEALTNVVRHARASHCVVTLTLNGKLQVEITDDGVGLPPNRRAGVGLFSMRERAEEIGGSCLVVAADAVRGGARVTAQLPITHYHPPTTNTYG